MLYWISDPNFVSVMIYINENIAKNAHNYAMVFIDDSGNCISAHDQEKVRETARGRETTARLFTKSIHFNSLFT